MPEPKEEDSMTKAKLEIVFITQSTATAQLTREVLLECMSNGIAECMVVLKSNN